MLRRGEETTATPTGPIEAKGGRSSVSPVLGPRQDLADTAGLGEVEAPAPPPPPPPPPPPVAEVETDEPPVADEASADDEEHS